MGASLARAEVLLRACHDRGATLAPEGDRLRIRAAQPLPPALVTEIARYKAEILDALNLDRVAAQWKPGEWLAYRESGALQTAKYAGISTTGRVNVWLADGALRAIPAGSVALDWLPDAAEIYEERVGIMLEAGVPENEARERGRDCTLEYIKRLAG